jgi:hypothetical protein
MAQEIDSPAALGNPVQKIGQDEFNRAPFCAALAERIARLGNKHGAAVVGLYGKWGFGKSSMLNLIEDHLDTHHGDDVVVAKFNPWLFTNEEDLLRSFFEVLEPMRNPDPGFFQKVGKVGRKYSGEFGMLADMVLGEPVKKIVDTVTRGPSLEDTHAALQRRDDKHTIVLLIDDLDRLDRAEVLLMLKLVRLNSNLPRVVYVLAFDDEIIARTIGSAYGLDPDAGREFLEKIVQFPFAVPAIGEERLLAYVLRHARRACDDAGVKVDRAAWDIYEAVCHKGFSARLRTPRQAIRYGAALDFSLPMLAGEVDPVQQMIIEGLRLLYPESYAVLRDRTGAALEAGNSGPLFTEVIMTMPGNEAAGRVILEALLNPDRPAIDSPFFHRRYWQRYFEYAVRPDGISNADLARLKARFDEPAVLAAACARLVQRNADEFAGVVRDLTRDVDTATRLGWITALMHASASLPDIGNRPTWQTLAHLIAGLALGTDLDDLAPLALPDIEQVLTNNCAPGMLPILRDALQAQDRLLCDRRIAANDFGGAPFDVATLGKVITARIEAAAPAFLSSMLIEDSVGFDLFAYLRIHATPSFRSWITSVLRAEPARSVDIVRHLAKDKLSHDLQFQSWIETTELAAILHAHLGEPLPREPRHPIDQIIALHGKYPSTFAG